MLGHLQRVVQTTMHEELLIIAYFRQLCTIVNYSVFTPVTTNTQGISKKNFLGLQVLEDAFFIRSLEFQ